MLKCKLWTPVFKLEPNRFLFELYKNILINFRINSSRLSGQIWLSFSRSRTLQGFFFLGWFLCSMTSIGKPLCDLSMFTGFVFVSWRKLLRKVASPLVFLTGSFRIPLAFVHQRWGKTFLGHCSQDLRSSSGISRPIAEIHHPKK